MWQFYHYSFLFGILYINYITEIADFSSVRQPSGKYANQTVKMQKNKSLDDIIIIYISKIIFRNYLHLELYFPGQSNSKTGHFI